MTDLPAFLNRVAPPADDSELLRRFTREGDAAAFELILRRHGPAVWGVCAALLPRHQDREDAFQAVFVALAEHAGRVRGGAGLAAWLRRCARNAALDILTRPAAAALDGSAASADRGPLEIAASAESASLVGEEVARLPEPFRLAFTLCHYEGLSNAAAAARLGCAVGTVESRLTRARRLLRSRLRPRGVGLPAAALPAGLVGRAVGSACGRAASPTVAAVAGRLRPPAGAKVPLTLAAAALLAAVGVVLANPTPETGRGPDTAVVGRLGLARWRHPAWVEGGCFSPDGRLVAAAGLPRASAGEGHAWPLRVTVWGRGTGEARRRFNLGRRGLAGLAFGHDGLLYTACLDRAGSGSLSRSLLQLDPKTGRIRRLNGQGMTRGAGRGSVMLADDADFVATVSEDGRRLTARKLPGLELMSTWTPPGGECRLARLRGRRAVVYARGDGQKRGWVVDLATGRALWAGRDPVRLTARLSPDGRTVMSYRGDHNLGFLRLWDADTGRRVGEIRPRPGESWSDPFFAGGGHVGVIAHSRATESHRLLRYTLSGRRVGERRFGRSWYLASSRVRTIGHYLVLSNQYGSVNSEVNIPDPRTHEPRHAVRAAGFVAAVEVFDARTLRRRHAVRGACCVALSAGGALLDFGGGSAGVLDLADGDLRAAAPRGPVSSAAFGRRGAFYTWGSGQGVVAWDTRAGTHRPVPIPAAAVEYGQAAFAADGSRFARVTAAGRVQAFALPGGRRLLDAAAGPGRFDRLWFTEGGRLRGFRRPAGRGPEVVTWRPGAGTPTRRPFGKSAEMGLWYHFAPGGRYALATPAHTHRLTGRRRPGPTCIRFDRVTGELRPVAGPAPPRRVTFSADGRLAALAGPKSLAVINMVTGGPVASVAVEHEPADLTFSPDGRRVAVFMRDGRLRLFDTDRGEFTHSFEGHLGPGLAVFSADGARLAGVSLDAPVIVHSVPPR